jgi:hypothetical protein
MSPAPYRQRKAVLAGQRYAADHVGSAGATHNQRRVFVNHRVEDSADAVVVGIALAYGLSAKAGLEIPEHRLRDEMPVSAHNLQAGNHTSSIRAMAISASASSATWQTRQIL